MVLHVSALAEAQTVNQSAVLTKKTLFLQVWLMCSRLQLFAVAQLQDHKVWYHRVPAKHAKRILRTINALEGCQG